MSTQKNSFRYRKALANLDTIPCVCGCRDFHEVVDDQIDYIVLEKTVVCNRCGHEVNHWVTGYWEQPQTFTELSKMPLKEIVEFFRYR